MSTIFPGAETINVKDVRIGEVYAEALTRNAHNVTWCFYCDVSETHREDMATREEAIDFLVKLHKRVLKTAKKFL